MLLSGCFGFLILFEELSEDLTNFTGSSKFLLDKT